MYLMELARNNDTKNLQVKVIRALQKNNGIAKRTVIQQETRINKKQFNETIESLIESETIKQLDIRNNSQGRPGIAYQLIKQ
jgi:predicted ArsR family transcriptional regulator